MCVDEHNSWKTLVWTPHKKTKHLPKAARLPNSSVWAKHIYSSTIYPHKDACIVITSCSTTGVRSDVDKRSQRNHPLQKETSFAFCSPEPVFLYRVLSISAYIYAHKHLLKASVFALACRCSLPYRFTRKVNVRKKGARISWLDDDVMPRWCRCF